VKFAQILNINLFCCAMNAQWRISLLRIANNIIAVTTHVETNKFIASNANTALWARLFVYAAAVHSAQLESYQQPHTPSTSFIYLSVFMFASTSTHVGAATCKCDRFSSYLIVVILSLWHHVNDVVWWNISFTPANGTLCAGLVQILFNQKNCERIY
jgi:hypothetical protein